MDHYFLAILLGFFWNEYIFCCKERSVSNIYCRNIISNANTQMIKDQIKFYCIIQFVTFGWKLPDIKFSSDLIKFHFIYILEADWNNLIQFLNRMCLAFFWPWSVATLCDDEHKVCSLCSSFNLFGVHWESHQACIMNPNLRSQSIITGVPFNIYRNLFIEL